MVSLGNLVEHQKGYAFPSKEYTDEGRPVVRVSDFTSDSVNHKTEKAIQESLADTFSRFMLKHGDIVIATVGSWGTNPNSVVGKTVRIPEEVDGALLNQNAVRLRAKNPLSQEFLYYSLRSNCFSKYIVGTAQGSANQASITLQDIFNFEILDCSPKEHYARSRILSRIDRKIELNRKTNETLEGIAKALFKSWFVDFDPVRARAEGRPTGLPNETSELFPDSFEESELGEIPSGWRFGDLNDLANLNPESWSAKNHPSELIYVDLSGTKNGTIEETVAYEWSDAPSRARRVLKEGDTIVGTVRPGNRTFSLIQRVGLTGSTGFAVIRPKQSFNASFLYVASTSDESIDRLAHLADGGAYPAVRPDVVMETPINIPSEPVQMLFGELTDSLFRKISVNEQETVVLGQLRDALLPRLISGELRVPDAEKLLEEAGV